MGFTYICMFVIEIAIYLARTLDDIQPSCHHHHDFISSVAHIYDIYDPLQRYQQQQCDIEYWRTHLKNSLVAASQDLVYIYICSFFYSCHSK